MAPVACLTAESYGVLLSKQRQDNFKLLSSTLTTLIFQRLEQQAFSVPKTFCKGRTKVCYFNLCHCPLFDMKRFFWWALNGNIQALKKLSTNAVAQYVELIAVKVWEKFILAWMVSLHKPIQQYGGLSRRCQVRSPSFLPHIESSWVSTSCRHQGEPKKLWLPRRTNGRLITTNSYFRWTSAMCITWLKQSWVSLVMTTICQARNNMLDQTPNMHFIGAHT